MGPAGHVRISKRPDDETDGVSVGKEPLILDRVEASIAGVAFHGRRRRDGLLFEELAASAKDAAHGEFRKNCLHHVRVDLPLIRSYALLEEVFELFIFVEQHAICQVSPVVLGQKVGSCAKGAAVRSVQTLLIGQFYRRSGIHRSARELW